MGVPIQKVNKVPLGPEARGEENGEEVSPPHPTLGSGRTSWSLVEGQGQSPGRKRFYCNLISADRLMLTAGDSKFFTFMSRKVGYGTTQSKKWGYRYPSYPRKLRLCVTKLPVSVEVWCLWARLVVQWVTAHVDDQWSDKVDCRENNVMYIGCINVNNMIKQHYFTVLYR